MRYLQEEGVVNGVSTVYGIGATGDRDGRPHESQN